MYTTARGGDRRVAGLVGRRLSRPCNGKRRGGVPARRDATPAVNFHL